MPRLLTASDRRALIHLADSLPIGDETRRAILAGVVKASRYGLEVYAKEFARKYRRYIDDWSVRGNVATIYFDSGAEVRFTETDFLEPLLVEIFDKKGQKRLSKNYHIDMVGGDISKDNMYRGIGGHLRRHRLVSR